MQHLSCMLMRISPRTFFRPHFVSTFYRIKNHTGEVTYQFINGNPINPFIPSLAFPIAAEMDQGHSSRISGSGGSGHRVLRSSVSRSYVPERPVFRNPMLMGHVPILDAGSLPISPVPISRTPVPSIYVSSALRSPVYNAGYSGMSLSPGPTASFGSAPSPVLTGYNSYVPSPMYGSYPGGVPVSPVPSTGYSPEMAGFHGGHVTTLLPPPSPNQAMIRTAGADMQY